MKGELKDFWRCSSKHKVSARESHEGRIERRALKGRGRKAKDPRISWRENWKLLSLFVLLLELILWISWRENWKNFILSELVSCDAAENLMKGELKELTGRARRRKQLALWISWRENWKLLRSLAEGLAVSRISWRENWKGPFDGKWWHGGPPQNLMKGELKGRQPHVVR